MMLPRYMGQVWGVAKTRKAHKCWLCDIEIPKGDRCYRPLTEGGQVQRFRRICFTCMENEAESGRAQGFRE